MKLIRAQCKNALFKKPNICQNRESLILIFGQEGEALESKDRHRYELHKGGESRRFTRMHTAAIIQLIAAPVTICQNMLDRGGVSIYVSGTHTTN